MTPRGAASGCALLLAASCSFDHGKVGDDGMVRLDGQELDASPLSLGLVAWYEAESVTTGTAVDSTGNGHTGSCTACPTIAAGHIGNAFVFNGSSRIDVTDNGAFTTSSGFTIAAWVRFGQLPGSGYACPVGKVLGSTVNNSYQLCYDGGPNTWTYVSVSSVGGVIDFMHAATGPTIGTWYHAAMTWDGTTKRLWLDGKIAAASPIGIGYDAMPLTLGADLDNGGLSASFTGDLDDVRIYDHELSADLIARLAAL